MELIVATILAFCGPDYGDCHEYIANCAITVQNPNPIEKNIAECYSNFVRRSE